MTKLSTQPKIMNLRPMPIPKQKYYSISMDVMPGIPKVGENDVVMVIVYSLSNGQLSYIILNKPQRKKWPNFF